MKLTREQKAIAKEYPHLLEVNYNGTYYFDIDWSKDIHSLGRICPCCGSDGAEGHGSACPFLFYMQTSPLGRTFLKNQIQLAVERERKAA